MTIYSHSRLSAFEECPRKFFYRYVAKVKVEREDTIETFLGTLVHDALEKLYRDRMFGKNLSVDELVEHFNSDWQQRFHDGVAIVRQEYSAEDYRRSGEECLRRYHVRHAPFDESTTLALEQRVTIDLDGTGGYRLQGFIDRLIRRSNGSVEIHDYKTNVKLPSQAEKDQDRQLALYQIGVQQCWPDVNEVELIWHFLRHDVTIRSTRTPAELDQLRKDTIYLIDDIESRRCETDFLPRESGLCGWCPFQKMCPARKHRFETASLPANRFLDEPGVALVDRHSSLTAKIAELKGEIAGLDEQRDEIVEALLAFGEREGVTTVVGSSREARVTELVQIVLPRKTAEPKEYAELDRCLRAGEAWHAVSSLDAHALRHIWKGDSDDPGDVRKTIEPFVMEHPTRQVRFRQRKDGNRVVEKNNSAESGDKPRAA